jgi:hypothetical protein
MSAAYGSTKILNSAAGVMLPRPIAPPIIVTDFIFYLIFGKALKSIAKFVFAPVTTKLIGSDCFIIL